MDISMDILYADHIKHRLIPFSEPQPDKNQAREAALFLADLEGILCAEPVSGNALRVSYDVLITTLVEIEEAISDFGLHLDHKLRYRLKRAVCHYTEETQRANCVCQGGEGNCTRNVFANCYEQGDHTCRDHRPEFWRQYL